MPIIWQIAYMAGYVLLLLLSLFANAKAKEVEAWKVELESRSDADEVFKQASRDYQRYVIRGLILAAPLAVLVMCLTWAIHRWLVFRTFPGEQVFSIPFPLWIVVGIPPGVFGGIALSLVLVRQRLPRVRYRAICVRDYAASTGKRASIVTTALAIVFLLMCAWLGNAFNNNYLSVGESSISHSSFSSISTDHIAASEISRLWLVTPLKELDPTVDALTPRAVIETESYGDYHVAGITELQVEQIQAALTAFADRWQIPYRRVYRWPLEKGRTKGGGG